MYLTVKQACQLHEGAQHIRINDATHLHMRRQAGNIFDETWGRTVTGGANKWDDCTKVLSSKDIELVMAKPWRG